MAEKNKKVVAITAAMPDGTGLNRFRKKFPERFFDVGIAEEHAVTFAAGMALGGMIPVFAVYSSFLQRGIDQILHDVCMQDLDVYKRQAQTRKIFKVCVMRHIPIFTFINKMDRDANDTFDLLDEIEKELGIATCPINWPIGSGKKFRGVFDRNTKKILTFSDTQKGTKEGVIEEIDINDPRADEVMDPEQKEQLMEEIEILDGASAEFSQEEVSNCLLYTSGVCM